MLCELLDILGNNWELLGAQAGGWEGSGQWAASEVGETDHHAPFDDLGSGSAAGGGHQCERVPIWSIGRWLEFEGRWHTYPRTYSP